MDMIQSFSGLNGILATASVLVRNGRPFSDLGTELAQVAKISQEDLNTLARKALPMDGALLVLVGDKKAILPQLEGLSLPAPVEYDASGRPVGGKR